MRAEHVWLVDRPCPRTLPPLFSALPNCGGGDTLWTHFQPFPDSYAVYLQLVHAAEAPYLAIVLVDHKGRAVEWADPAYTLAGLTTMITTKLRGEYHHTVEIVRAPAAHPRKDAPSRSPEPDPPCATSHSQL